MTRTNSEPTESRSNDDITSIEHHRATVLQKRLTRPPISRLPSELLISTLHLTLPKIDFESTSGANSARLYMRMLYNIRQVAKQWQEVIDGTPSFWTIIVSTIPLHVNNAATMRSGSIPLIIVYKYADQPNEEGLPSPEEFLQTILHTRSRWSAVTLDFRDDKDMSGYLADPAPLLQTIAIRSSLKGEVDTEPLDLLGGHPNNIRNVMISNASIQWKMGLFTELKTLSLSRVRSNLTAGHIVDYLGTSPFLEELSIEGDLQMATHQSSYPTISLSQLRSIDIECRNDNATDYILQHIRAPSCINFTVSLGGEGETDYPRFMNETLNPFQGLLRKIHIENGASEMSVRTLNFHWRSNVRPDGSHGFSIYIGRFYPLGIRWVGKILQEEPGLRVELTYDAALSDEVLRDIASLQCTTRLLVAVDGVEQIFSFLGQPLRPSASLPSLPCLRDFFIASMGWSTLDLLDMVQSRLSAFSKSARHPPPLTISVWRGTFTWDGIPQPIIDLKTLIKIREVEGIECVQLVGKDDLEGALAITWNEEASQPN